MDKPRFNWLSNLSSAVPFFVYLFHILNLIGTIEQKMKLNN